MSGRLSPSGLDKVVDFQGGSRHGGVLIRLPLCFRQFRAISAGDATDSVRACFQAWLEDYGTGSREDAALLAQVRRFLETHGASRFQSVEAESATIYNRAGFWRDKDGVRQYLVLPETFRTEVVAGYRPAAACKVLITAGLLQPGKDRVMDKVRLPGFSGPQWVYVLTTGTEAEQ
jgi:putative DNA primase/helicase